MHRVDATAAVATQPTLSGPYNVGAGIAGATDLTGWQQYAFLDFDPTGNDHHSLSTAGKSSLKLRANFEAADAVRAIPIEVVKI